MNGSSIRCDVYVLGHRTVRSFFREADLADAMSRVHIVNARAGDEEDLIGYAWAALLMNTDLIKWAVCWVEGATAGGSGDSLVRRIQRTSARVNVNLSDSADSTHAMADGHGGTIWIAETVPVEWVRMLDMFQNATMIENKLCAILDVAALLLHEMTHVMLLSVGDTGDQTRHCYDSYLIENIFRWGIFNRYSEVAWVKDDTGVLRTTCCGNQASESVWGRRTALNALGRSSSCDWR